jgi:hypothetical protein
VIPVHLQKSLQQSIVKNIAHPGQHYNTSNGEYLGFNTLDPTCIAAAAFIISSSQSTILLKILVVFYQAPLQPDPAPNQNHFPENLKSILFFVT